jgi:trehalose-6-phosphate synthase
MDGATLVNPYDPEECARKLRDELVLPADERAARMERLQAEPRTIYDWMGDIFTRWGQVAVGRSPARTDAAPGEDELFDRSVPPQRWEFRDTEPIEPDS